MAIVAAEGEGEGDFQGTTGRDAFVVTYGGVNVSVTRSTNGQPPVTLGNVSPAIPINLNGLGGDDSLTVGWIEYQRSIRSSQRFGAVNASTINWVSVEKLTIRGSNGDDCVSRERRLGDRRHTSSRRS